MTKYLTVAQYVAAGDFPITADLTLLKLARTIKRAEEDIDAFMEFDPRLGGFEPGVRWVQAPFDKKTRKIRIPNFPVPVRRALRYQIQVSTQTATGAGFFANIATGDIAYNVFDAYAEIVPLQSITYALTPVLVQFGLDPPLIQWDYSAGFYFGVLKETLIGDASNEVYSAEQGFWATSYDLALSIQPQTPPPIPAVVYVNGVVDTSGIIDPVEGTVTFAAGVRQPGDIVKADYTYTIPDKVRGATLDQTTYILGQAALNQQGLTGIDFARSGQQQIKRTDASEAGLCTRAVDKLKGYKLIGIA